MGKSLLDFVMALVRDPEAAARYAADPAGTLAEAHLEGVTLADVNNLIPVVADSLAATTPQWGAVADPANVWTSGAAAAALDAFTVHQPTVHQSPVHKSPSEPDAYPVITVPADQKPIDQSGSPPSEAPVVTPVHQAPDLATAGGAEDADWQYLPPLEAQSEQHPGDLSGLEPF